MLNNNLPRLDILHLEGNINHFDLQVKNKVDNTFIDLNDNPITLVIKDARNNEVGTPTVTVINAEKVRVKIAESVPADYSGTLRYSISMLDNNTNKNIYLVAGNIDCVDTEHVIASTAQYVANQANVTIETQIGAVNNVIVETQIGMQGPIGPQGPAGAQGPAGNINMDIIILEGIMTGVHNMDTGHIGNDITVVVNNNGTDVDINILVMSGHISYQNTHISLNDKQVLYIYKIQNYFTWHVY